jgi:hypothetical protein
MARKIHSVDVTCDGETETYFYRKPSGRLMLQQSDKVKNGTLTNEQSSNELLAECVVNEDGTSITKDRVAEILDKDWAVLQQLNVAMMPPKKEETKNV